MPTPPKTKPPIVNRSKYADILAKPITAEGNNIVGEDTVIPSVDWWSGLGHTYVSGSAKKGDLITKKGDEYFLYNQGEKRKTGIPYGLISIGNINSRDEESTSESPMIKKINSVVKNNTPDPIDVIRKPIEFGQNQTFNPNTGDYIDYDGKNIKPIVEQYKKGGLVSKVKKYAIGGEIESEEFKQFNGQNPATIGAASTALDYALPGAGKAYGLAQSLIGNKTSKMSEVDPLTGKFIDKDKARKAGLINSYTNSGVVGLVQNFKDPNKSFGEKALSLGTLGVSDLFNNKRNVDRMESENIATVDAQKKEEQRMQNEIIQQQRLAKQMAERKANYSTGGLIKGKGTGTSDSISAKIKEDSFVVPSKNADKAEVVRKVILAPSSKKKANLNQSNGEKVKVSNGEHLFTPIEVEKIENTLGDNFLNKLAPESDKLEDSYEIELAKGGPIPGVKNPQMNNKNIKSSNNKSTKKAPVISSDYLISRSMSLPVNQTEEDIIINENLSPSPQVGYDNTTGKQISPSVLGSLGSVAEYAIPMLQAGYGLSQLKKLGKRPVGELDKDYLSSIAKAQENVQLANAQAKYGFTPEEQALINSENANATSAQRFSARNLSGGSAGNAYNMERAASNQQFGRGLKAAVENRNLMLQKQAVAQNQQAYLDSLNANKANMNRTLFNDQASAWQQNQQAGSGLLAAGLNNIIGAKRYNDELAALKQTGDIRNSAYNSLGQ